MKRTLIQENKTLKTLRAHNLQLKNTIARKAVELNEKERELEIETALEKVRAIAMGMKAPADMLEVCKTISLQLQSLGVKEIRNVQTAIFYVQKGVYMNYEYYAKHRKTFITETDYTNHKIAKAFASKMIKGKGQSYYTAIKGKKVKEWLSYQKTTNVFIDKYLEKASSLNYYWHSLGPVALGISTYVPLSKNELVLFRRFLNVFELAYTRYLDIELALTQAKEAQVELGLERVRARAMAMQQSDELAELVDTVFRELTKLDFVLDRCLIMIYDKNSKGSTWWLSSEQGAAGMRGLYVDYHPNEVYELYLKYWSVRKEKWQYVLEGKIKRSWDNYIFKFTELSFLPDPVKVAMRSLPRIYLNVSFNSFGSLTFSSFEPLGENEFDILLRFAKVFDQTYTRFLDLQKAEAQAREAQIEVALERIRARALSMHRSEELLEVAKVLREQLDKLGQPELETSAIHFYEQDDKNIVSWRAFRISSSKQESITYNRMDIPKNSCAFVREMENRYRGKEKDYTLV
jgi:hypothetical protein